jgi:hypothetical protein
MARRQGLEATVYALLAGFQNFGGVVSSQIGLFAMQVFPTPRSAGQRVDGRDGKISGLTDCGWGGWEGGALW